MESKSKKLILIFSIVLFVVTILCLSFIFEHSDLLDIKIACQIKYDFDNLYQCLYKIINDKIILQEQIREYDKTSMEYYLIYI